MNVMTLYETVRSSKTPVVTQNCPTRTLTSFSSIQLSRAGLPFYLSLISPPAKLHLGVKAVGEWQEICQL